MRLRRRPAEVPDHRGDLRGLGQLRPVQVRLVRGELAHDEADPVQRRVAQQPVGVGLQRALGENRALPVVHEPLGDRGVGDHAGRRGHVALLHREHDVVVQRLVEPLDEHGVGGQTGAADAEPGPPGHVLDRVGDPPEALALGDGLQVAPRTPR